MVRVSAYSSELATAARESPQRGIIHSVFRAAANILLPRELLLSLNAADTVAMPNGLQLSCPAGAWPFSALRVGMSVLFGGGRLHIEAINCALDLTTCPLWEAHIVRPEVLDAHIVAGNLLYLQQQLAAGPLPGSLVDIPSLAQAQQRWGEAYASCEVLADMAGNLCGRGTGLTPAGDDILTGWMACNWLLHGPTEQLLAACQQVLQVARQRTHLLSLCWLSYAAAGNVALPIRALLEAITQAQPLQLEAAARAVLAMGATSGYDVLQGILLAHGASKRADMLSQEQ